MGDTAKFILSVGGANQESRDFSQAIAGEEGVLEAASGISDAVQQFGFDGVDVAWLNPGENNNLKANRINLVRLLRVLRLLMPEMSLSVTAVLEPRYFDIPSIDVYVDFVNLLTVDYHDPTKPSHVAPLFSLADEDRSNVVSCSIGEKKTTSLFLSVHSCTVSKLSPRQDLIRRK